MNPDHSRCATNNEDKIKSSAHQLKQDDYISIGTDNVNNPPHLRQFQFGQRDQATCASGSSGKVSKVIDSLLLIKFQDFIVDSSNNWQWEDENSCNFSFVDSMTFLPDEDYYEERDKGKNDDDEDDEDSICDSIRETVRRRLKQSTMSSSSDNEYSD